MSKIDDNWQEKFEVAKRYYEEHGTLYVPEKDRYYGGFDFRSWVDHQKQMKNNPKPSKRARKRMKQLESLGISFNISVWDNNYKIAKRFYEEYGHLNIAYGRKYRGINLGYWIMRQRMLIKKDRLTAEDKRRIHLLDDIGMMWSYDKNQHINSKWMYEYDTVKDWINLYYNGKCPKKIPNRKFRDLNVRKWILSQDKYKYRNCRHVIEQKVELLKQIGIEL